MIATLYDKFKPWSEKGSVWIISDTHFDDTDCKFMDPGWITPKEQMNILKNMCHKNDTLIHLGDVGDASYLDELKCYKVLISGNHDILSKVASHFDEVYTGPLFIADRILLSHEPIKGLEDFCLNIHGHDHSNVVMCFNENCKRVTHLNLACNISNYTPINLGKIIKEGFLSGTQNYHRITIDKASEREK